MSQKDIDKDWISQTIKDFMRDSPLNSIQNQTGEKAWEEPLVGFSSGGDPLYDEFKSHIGDFYLKPLEFFALTFPETKATAEEITVISWILPHTSQTKQDNQKESRFPSERWVRSRMFGEKANAKLREHLVSSLHAEGFKVLSPDNSPFKKGGISKLYGRAASWSERHAAYAAGLGTFGLCDGLITPVGKAIRIGSVIAQIKIPPTERPYQNHHAYCLYYSQGICLKCVKRCPAGAISAEKGHDKVKCDDYLNKVTVDYIKLHFNFDGHACGLCQTGVPCASKIPLEVME